MYLNLNIESSLSLCLNIEPSIMNGIIYNDISILNGSIILFMHSNQLRKQNRMQKVSLILLENRSMQ